MNQQVVDPVCGMTVEPGPTAAQTDYAGKTYYFCCNGCKAAFTKEPEKYLQNQPDHHASHHQHVQ